MTDVAVGVDIGGTSSRALAVYADGRVAGRGTAGGGNPNSHPPALAAKRVAEAVAAALPTGSVVAGCLLGMAGESKVTDPAVLSVFETALRHAGVGCPIEVVSDAEVAFASATSSPDGTVLIGGTGSVAARIVARRKESWRGGWGWLLGDEGSAYWIGRQAVRSTLAVLQSTEAVGPLGRAVLDAAVAEPFTDDVAGRRLALSRLITSANAEAPIRLARFASLVSELATTDPAAADIIAEAAGLLIDQAHIARAPGETTPVVLAGSVIGPTSPVGQALRERLSGETEVLFAPDGALGAAWLAALEAWGPKAPRPQA
ncbi:MAG: BadF/BadG/BcrA/BcrD ATPase family protein [Actinophytocola sp.]|uniref:N-acetylglucosamine kinase n=1 Tax=Actinophytocola sp. TaxID=1872138 RepID=UPI003C75384E